MTYWEIFQKERYGNVLPAYVNIHGEELENGVVEADSCAAWMENEADKQLS